MKITRAAVTAIIVCSKKWDGFTHAAGVHACFGAVEIGWREANAAL